MCVQARHDAEATSWLRDRNSAHRPDASTKRLRRRAPSERAPPVHCAGSRTTPQRHAVASTQRYRPLEGRRDRRARRPDSRCNRPVVDPVRPVVDPVRPCAPARPEPTAPPTCSRGGGALRRWRDGQVGGPKVRRLHRRSKAPPALLHHPRAACGRDLLVRAPVQASQAQRGTLKVLACDPGRVFSGNNPTYGGAPAARSLAHFSRRLGSWASWPMRQAQTSFGPA